VGPGYLLGLPAPHSYTQEEHFCQHLLHSSIADGDAQLDIAGPHRRLHLRIAQHDNGDAALPREPRIDDEALRMKQGERR
jgi:hypothetical protein